MSLWQYNAWCEAYRKRKQDELAIQVQAAYYCAYWNSGAKHKRSLSSVLKQILRSDRKTKKGPPLDIDAVRKKFRQLEELRTYGYTKE